MDTGTQCPNCARPLSFWTTFGAPLQRIVCPSCKAHLRYASTGWMTLAFFAVWFAMGALAYALLSEDKRGLVLIVALIGPGPVLEMPYTWYLRRYGRLETSATTVV